MIKELIANKVYCRIFGKNFKESTHRYSRYNAASSAELTQIEANIAAIAEATGCAHAVTLRQVHGAGIVEVDNSHDFSKEETADGAITSEAGVVLCIQTADCVPVLLASSKGNVIGAAHCGWRSAKADIASNIVAAMQEREAQDIVAFMGPSVQQDSYEVNLNYYNNFLQDDASNERFFIASTKKSHYMFDLPAYVKSKLQAAGVSRIEQMLDDTYSLADKYPSYRRTCHMNEADNGQRILSAIFIKP